jgi:hypothetical protein
LGIVFLGFNGGIASVYFIDTGPGPDILGGWALENLGPNYTFFYAAEFTLPQKATNTSIEGWIAAFGSGQLMTAIYSNAGNIPGSKIYSAPFSISIDPNYSAGWYGAKGLNWSLAPGTYWVSFELDPLVPQTHGMPNPSANPLGNEAWWDGNQWYNANDFGQNLDIGVRIQATFAGRSVPAIVGLLLNE